MERVSGGSPGVAEGYVAIGRIGGPWGIRGDVKVTLHTDFPERFQELEVVYLGPEARPLRLVSWRRHKNYVLLHLEGFDDPTASEELRGLWVQVPQSEVVPLSEDERYVYELLELQVRTTQGTYLGHVTEVLFTAANEVLVVQGEGGEILIPYIKDVVVQEDLEAGEIIVEPVPGLLD
jgi:16S rRNA processing protein RimM